MAADKIAQTTLLNRNFVKSMVCGPRNIVQVKKALGSNSLRKRLYRKAGPSRPHFVRAYQEGQLSLYLGLGDLSGFQVVVMGTPKTCEEKWKKLYSSFANRSSRIVSRIGQIDVTANDSFTESSGETKYVTGRISSLDVGDEHEGGQFLDSEGFLIFSRSALSIKIVEEEKGDGSTDLFFRTLVQIWVAPSKQHLLGEVVLPTTSLYGQCVPLFPKVGMPQCLSQVGNVTFRMTIQCVLQEYHDEWSDNVFMQDVLGMIWANNVLDEKRVSSSIQVGSLLPRNSRYFRLVKNVEEMVVLPPVEPYPDWFTTEEWYPTSFLADLGQDYQQELDTEMYDFMALLHGFETFTFVQSRFRLRQMVSGRGLTLGGISNLVELENSRARREQEAYDLARHDGMPELLQGLEDEGHLIRRLD